MNDTIRDLEQKVKYTVRGGIARKWYAREICFCFFYLALALIVLRTTNIEIIESNRIEYHDDIYDYTAVGKQHS